MNQHSESEPSAEEGRRAESDLVADVMPERIDSDQEETEQVEEENQAEAAPCEGGAAEGDPNGDGSRKDTQSSAVDDDLKGSPKEIPAEHCRNCGEALVGSYCHRCGQKVVDHHQYSVKAFIGHAFHHITHFDLKAFKTLPPIIFRPGLVTRDYLNGRQTRYVGPIQLFIIVNLLFFLLKAGGLFHYSLDAYRSQPRMAALVEGTIARLGVTSDIYEARFDTALHFQQKSYILLLIPIFALLMKLLYARSKRYYVEHLIFSFHFFSFYLIFLLVLPIIFYLLDGIASLVGARVPGGDVAIFALLMPTSALYLTIALRRVYGQSYLAASLKGIVLAFSLLPLILLYQILLFYIVWYTL